MSDTEEIRAQALEVAAGWSGPDAPDAWQLTAALFRMIAEHEVLLGRLADLPPDRLPALLAGAAVSFLVQRDRAAPLARYFPEPGGPQPPFDAGFYAAAEDLVSSRIDEILALCHAHRYQMNEVGRSTQIALGITATTGGRGDPIGLADLGTGAGLGLALDRYRYRIGGQAHGPQDAQLTLTCELRGVERPPALRLPPIADRAGIDASPVDLQDPLSRAWLQACAPPEASSLARLSAAIGVASQTQPAIIAGDAVGMLPSVLRSLAPGHSVVVVDAYTAVFLTAPELSRLADVLASAAEKRPVTWLSLDPLVPLGRAGRDSVQGLPLPSWLISDYQRHGVFAVLGARTFHGTSDTGQLLARAHPSGQWVEWLASPGAELSVRQATASEPAPRPRRQSARG